jgi:hypothetical protein
MASVAGLWICDGDQVADVTWGRGVFWKKLPGLPTFAHDLKTDGIDCRKLPYADGSLDVVVLDPPYRPTHGSKGFAGNGLAEAYQLGGNVLDSINDVSDLYGAALEEVLVKCQDLSYGHRLHLFSLDVLQLMVAAGFEFADQFILVNESRLSSGAWEKQERARRAHSVLWVGVRVDG